MAVCRTGWVEFIIFRQQAPGSRTHDRLAGLVFKTFLPYKRISPILFSPIPFDSDGPNDFEKSVITLS